MTRDHYCYCTDDACLGCLPTLDDVRAMHILDRWAEMFKRCISQTPETKTLDGALAAIELDEPWYLDVSRRLKAGEDIHDAIEHANPRLVNV